MTTRAQRDILWQASDRIQQRRNAVYDRILAAKSEGKPQHTIDRLEGIYEGMADDVLMLEAMRAVS